MVPVPFRPVAFLTAVVVVAGLVAPASTDDKKPAGKEALKGLPPAKLMGRPVRFPGWEKDERMTLRDGLEQLAELYGVRFGVDEAAFRAEVPPIPEVLSTPVVDRAPLPRMEGIPLEVVLRRVLARVPSTSGTTFVIRRDEVEITTEQAKQLEFWGPRYSGPFLPLVHAHFEKVPLEAALKELAEAAEYNIVVDVRAAEKAKAPVTARLANVPLDTAVRLLADMADLKPYLVDNVLYVTTPENAGRLAKPDGHRPGAEGGEGVPPLPPEPRIGAGRSRASGAPQPPLLP